ncbi:MAG: histidine kinase [Flavobacteriia bacterium]|nr:MAG: histidine kinase [Flavobacteriia bacterium]
MDIEAFKIVVFLSSITLLLILGIFITLFILFQRKKTAMTLEQREKERMYEETISKSSIEIREHTLKGIAWELHDNVGQLLSLAQLELNILKSKPGNYQDKISEIANIVGTSLSEIRLLSKTLNPEFISNVGLIDSIQLEIDRFNRLNYIDAQMSIEGEPYQVSNKDQVILFRIIQEFFSNTIKHAQASELRVTLIYQPDNLEITVADNGIGFDISRVEQGSGLMNMKSRIQMINAKLEIISGEKGTKIVMKYPNNLNQ